jgi:hypothetical protein
MKKINIILIAFALAMTMSQCKKNEVQPVSNDDVVTITLDINNNDGSRVVVNTATGTVDFESGDKIYVGSGGKYVGFLTHNGTNFSGNITNPTENQPLQFYFLGNVTPTETLSAGTTEECSVIISDQTEHLPVISCAASYENYVSGVTAYSAHLLNKCALVKFNVTTPSNAAICITGMKNKVTVDFAQNTMTPCVDSEGVIMLPAGNGEDVEKWAILLPQEALGEGEEGSVYSEDGIYMGMRPEIPVISENGYLAEGITMTIDIGGVPVGAINGLFRINDNGDQVYFSQGNLQYQASSNTWRFAENQWDYVGGIENGVNYGNVTGSSNNYISSTYNGWIDLFGWGTSGYNHGAVCYQPWSTNTISDYYYAYGLYYYNLNSQNGQADWGYNTINNGGNTENKWRTLTTSEWRYVFSRNTPSGIRFAKAIVNGTSGVILLPDDWNSSYYSLNSVNNVNASYNTNAISSSDWMSNLEAHGAVFLPTTGYRQGFAINIEAIGCYWSASYFDQSWVYYVFFDEGNINTVIWTSRHCGQSVRLVAPAN